MAYGKTYYSPLTSIAGTFTTSERDPLRKAKEWLFWHSELGITPEMKRLHRIRYGGDDMSLMERFSRKVAGVLHDAITHGNFGEDWYSNPEYLRLRHACDYYTDRAEYFARKEISHETY